MNIVVCIKQVPGTTEVKIDPQTNTLIRQGVQGIINPLDTYALEEGVRLKEKHGGRVAALSMGPPQAEESLREAISLGIDDGILVSDRALAGSDTLATAYILAKAVRKMGEVDLVICGRQTIDGDTGQVGPELAVRLDMPFVAYVSRVEGVGEGFVRMQRMVDDGYETMEMPLPGIITVVKEINTPRLPSLRGMMRAKSAKITVWSAAELGVEPDKAGLTGSPTQVVRIFTPERHRKAQVLSGSVEAQVDQLLGLLCEQQLI